MEGLTQNLIESATAIPEIWAAVGLILFIHFFLLKWYKYFPSFLYSMQNLL